MTQKVVDQINCPGQGLSRCPSLLIKHINTIGGDCPSIFSAEVTSWHSHQNIQSWIHKLALVGSRSEHTVRISGCLERKVSLTSFDFYTEESNFWFLNERNTSANVAMVMHFKSSVYSASLTLLPVGGTQHSTPGSRGPDLNCWYRDTEAFSCVKTIMFQCNWLFCLSHWQAEKTKL